jgi:hypothetical protein
MGTYLSQPNPVTARWEGEDHLRDPNFQLDAFRVSPLFIVFLRLRVLSCSLSVLIGQTLNFLLSIGHLGCCIVLLLDFRSTARHLEVLVHGTDV